MTARNFAGDDYDLTPVAPSLECSFMTRWFFSLALAFFAFDSTSYAQTLDPELLAGIQARSIGPAGMSGRVTDVQCVESNPDVVWVAAATGGVWKSTNGGLTFEPVFDDQPVHAIGSLAIATSSPDDVWVGTGEGNVRNSASIGNGVYRTRDGGRTWSHLGLVASERIPRIALDPRDPDVAFVAALGPEWGESKERGVFRTRDGGRSWQQILAVDPRTGCADLAVDPSNPDHLLAAMWQFRRWPYFFRSGGPSSGLYESFDGGETWRRLEVEDGMPKGDLGRIGVAFCRSRPEIVYALVEADQSALLCSDNGGRSFAAVNTELNVNPRPFYFCDIRVDPVWPNRVYALDYYVRVSDDGGKSFANLPGATQVHPDFHALWIDPSDPDHLWFGNDGGIAESHDRGRTSRFVENLPLAQFYHVAVDNAVPYNVLGGMQDNMSWRGPNTVWFGGGIRNHEWQLVGGGDGFDTLPDPTEPDAGYSMSQGGYLYRWNAKTGEQRFSKPLGPEGVELRFNWNAGIAIDPFDPNIVYYGSQFVHRSNDRAATFSVLSPDLTTNDPEKQRQRDSGGLTPDVTAAENHCSIITIAPSPAKRGVIWVGSDDGRLHLTQDNGGTWTSVEANVPGVPANTWIPHIEASPHDPAAAFVVFDDHRRSNFTPYVYATTDYGRTWKNLVTPAIRGYAHVVEADPVDPTLLWLGTEFGLYVSVDGGAQWVEYRHGLPTASVMDLVTHPRDHDLVIGTHGRSAFVIDDVRPLREIDAATLAEPLRLYAMAPAQQHWIGPEVGGFAQGAGEFYGKNREYGALVTFSLADAALPHPDVDKDKTAKAAERAEQAKLARETPYEPRGVTPTGDAAVADAEKKDDAPKKAEIGIFDSTGQRIRTFDAAVHRGVNRVAWDLRRDDFDSPGVDNASGPKQSPFAAPGAEVPPGNYTVIVRYGEHEARGGVVVLPDPRATLTADAARARYETILEAGRLRDSVAKTVKAIGETRKDVESLAAKVRAANAERDALARRTGEPAPKEPVKDELVDACDAFLKDLATFERKLWVAPRSQSKGIVYDDDTFLALLRATEGALGSSPQPPTPTHLAMLERAKKNWPPLAEEWRAFASSRLPNLQLLAKARGFGEPVRATPGG
jgi:photosystem II stability/assembly factor-like uncharacterized protein